MAKDKDTIEDALEDFKRCSEAESDNRECALDDLRFARLGEQWPDDVVRSRGENRPRLTLNRMPSIIRQVVNDARMNRPTIKVKPVDNGSDPETAKIINGLIRNIEYISDAEVAYDTAVDFAASCGFGYFRVDVDYACDDTFDLDIMINRIANPFSVYSDPDSDAADSSDWNRSFIVTDMSREEFRREHKGAEEVDWEGSGYGNLPTEWGDKDTIRLAEYWTREKVDVMLHRLATGEILDDERMMRLREEGFELDVMGSRQSKRHKVTHRLMTGAEVLKTTEWKGRYIPIIPVYGEEVNVEGKRHFRSLIRDAKDPQRMFNYWRSISTEMVALSPKAPWLAKKGSLVDPQKWHTANAQNWPYLEYTGEVMPQRQQFNAAPAGALQEALNASDDIKAITGIYDASLGARSNETSGVAINARKIEGDVGTFHIIDNLSRAIRHTGRIVLDLLPSVYNTERVIRVMGEDGKEDTAPINQQYPVEEQDQQGNTVISYKMHDLTVGKYDLVVDAGPGFTTRREESAAQMIELIRANPAIAPVIMDLLVKNLDWPGAEEIAERLQKMLPQQIQGQDPRLQQMQQALQQLQGALQQMKQENQSLKFDKSMDAGKLQIDNRKADVDAYKAETERLSLFQQDEVQFAQMQNQTYQQAMNSPDIYPPP